METLLLLLGGLALLTVGGDFVVRGAVGVARRLGVSELMIGLTLLGFGTSTPELLTSVNAALAGSPGIAIGNVVGSNISNILLVFAIVAIVRPVAIDPKAISRDGVVMVGATLLLIAVAIFFGEVSRTVGALFCALLLTYIIYAWRTESAGPAKELREAEAKQVDGLKLPMIAYLGFALGGITLLIFGADLLVKGAIILAQAAGLSETVIGLTIVAVGTSLPELVASLAAALKGRSDVAFGNIVGSNIYNVLGILGITALIQPVAVPPDMTSREWVAIYGAALLLLLHASTGARVGRREGTFLLAHYAAYTWLLVAVR